jgi:hypothetical protein
MALESECCVCLSAGRFFIVVKTVNSDQATKRHRWQSRQVERCSTMSLSQEGGRALGNEACLELRGDATVGQRESDLRVLHRHDGNEIATRSSTTHN